MGTAVPKYADDDVFERPLPGSKHSSPGEGQTADPVYIDIPDIYIIFAYVPCGCMRYVALYVSPSPLPSHRNAEGTLSKFRCTRERN